MVFWKIPSIFISVYIGLPQPFPAACYLNEYLELYPFRLDEMSVHCKPFPSCVAVWSAGSMHAALQLLAHVPF